MRVGVVLAGGGVVGAAYHAGVLTALEHDLGWDPRAADIVVGTSAGALVGSLLRIGVRASDLAAWTVDAPLSPTGRAIADLEQPVFDPVSLRQMLRVPRVPHPVAVLAALSRPHRFDPFRSFITHLPDGSRRLEPHFEFLGTGWTDRPLWVCVVRRNDGRRVVLGRDHVPRDGLAAAAAASCAVPGYFAPVTVDGVRYLDGGVASASNADVLRDAQLDLVIALSPMSAALDVSRWGLDGAVRRRTGARLRSELDRLRRGGTRVVTFEPGAEVLAEMCVDFMSAERRREIVTASFLEAGAQAREPARAELLAFLGGRTHAAA